MGADEMKKSKQYHRDYHTLSKMMRPEEFTLLCSLIRHRRKNPEEYLDDYNDDDNDNDHYIPAYLNPDFWSI